MSVGGCLMVWGMQEGEERGPGSEGDQGGPTPMEVGE